MLAAYWHKNGLEVFRVSSKGIVKVASGEVDSLAPVRSLSKKVLIVGRDVLLHTRKRYPSISKKKLDMAVKMEIDELFPIKNPSFHYEVFEASNTYLTVDIWAWDKAGEERIKGIFGFTHAVPEHLSIIADNEMIILGSDGITHMLAYSGGKFLGSSSVSGQINMQSVELFLRGLGRHSEGIKCAKLPGPLDMDLKSAGMEEVVISEDRGYPLCLEYMERIDLRRFKVKSPGKLLQNVETVFRFAVYATLAFTLALFFTNRNYERTINETNKNIKRLSSEINAISLNQVVDPGQNTVEEINKKLAVRISPLGVMNLIAGHLPDNTSVTRISINERHVEIALSSNNPLDVLNAMGSADGVKGVRLKGTPFKDNRGYYSFQMEIEL